MNSQEITIPEVDFEKVFKELQNQAETLFPSLQQEMKTFNDSHIVVESYQQYLNSIDQAPPAISSNHVS